MARSDQLAMVRRSRNEKGWNTSGSAALVLVVVMLVDTFEKEEFVIVKKVLPVVQSN